MKTLRFLAALYMITLTGSLLSAQGELSILMGIHPPSRIANNVSGKHTALQYNMVTMHDMSYGVAMQYSRFGEKHSSFAAAQITSLNGFASYPLLKTPRVKPYLKIELGAAYANTAPGLEARYSTGKQSAANFISAQIAPAIGSQIALSGAFTLQIEYKKTIHFGHANVAEGAYNYGAIDLGVTYKFISEHKRKRTSRSSIVRCTTNRKSGATSCFRFR